METVEKYMENMNSKWKSSYIKLMEIVDRNIPNGFEKVMQYHLPTYVVPLKIYPKGYLDQKDPLPFISLAAQKNYISFYHLGIYSDKELLTWFQKEYKSRVSTKLNMGKSCIRFTNTKKIPYELIEELVKKVAVDSWISLYEKTRR